MLLVFVSLLQTHKGPSHLACSVRCLEQVHEQQRKNNSHMMPGKESGAPRPLMWLLLSAAAVTVRNMQQLFLIYVSRFVGDTTRCSLVCQSKQKIKMFVVPLSLPLPREEWGEEEEIVVP